MLICSLDDDKYKLEEKKYELMSLKEAKQLAEVLRLSLSLIR
jgi:hypothetical protein